MSQSFNTLVDLLSRPEFVAGLIAGLVALGLAVTLARTRPGGWAILLVIATLAATNLTVERRLGVVAGATTLALGGWLAASPRSRSIKPLAWPLIISGALAVALRGDIEGGAWIWAIAAVLMILVGWLLAGWAETFPSTLVGPMWIVTAFGVWATIPETDNARALLGASIPMLFATLPAIGRQFLVAGAYPLGAILVWIIMVGGETRTASIVGGIACIGALGLLPALRQGFETTVLSKPRLILILHVGLVLVASRFLGLLESLPLAVAGAVVLVAAGYLSARAITNTPAATTDRNSISSKKP